MKIVHNYTNEILYECECDTLKEMKEYALDNGAEFINTCLWHLEASGDEIKSIVMFHFPIFFTRDHLWIACLNHSIETWKVHGDEIIKNLEADGVAFWKKHKNFIFSEIEQSFKVEA